MSLLPFLVAAILGTATLLVARSRRWLSADGMVAAVPVGAAVILGTGLAGLLLLLLFFLTTSLLTVAPARRRSGGPGDRQGRTAAQVLANGGVAALAGIVAAAGAGEWAAQALAGSLAAAMADSWATEIGTAGGAPTWLITGGRVEPGHSGGVSVPGTAAGLAGAALLAGAAAGLSRLDLFAAPGFLAILVAGVCGMGLDSLLGATLESRVRFVTNDTINLAATVAGALLAGALA